MRRIKILLFASMFLMPLVSFADHAIPPSTQLNINAVIKVNDREQVFDQLVNQSQELSGYFSVRTDDELTLRIPIDGVEKFNVYLEGKGKVIDYQIASQYHGDTLIRLSSLIQAKQDLLVSYEGMLSDASSVDGLLSIEKAMIELTEEIETMVNQKNNIEQQLSMATFHIVLQFRDRSAPKNKTVSSFPWLNEMGLPQLLEDFK